MRLCTFSFAIVLMASPLLAETVEDSLVRQLQAQGFERITIERTFLGRLRIEAYSDTLERELVVNPRTGEVLRDYWEPFEDDDDNVPQLNDPHAEIDDDDGFLDFEDDDFEGDEDLLDFDEDDFDEDDFDDDDFRDDGFEDDDSFDEDDDEDDGDEDDE